jgi:hypothetical protein
VREALANLEHRAPITDRTVFHVASVSKQITGYAVARLADDGKLSMQVLPDAGIAGIALANHAGVDTERLCAAVVGLPEPAPAPAPTPSLDRTEPVTPAAYPGIFIARSRVDGARNLRFDRIR